MWLVYPSIICNYILVGGHAWQWSQSEGQDVCSLLHHPGNKIVGRAGIAFSRNPLRYPPGIEYNVECHVDDLPWPTCSLYYALRSFVECASMPMMKKVIGYVCWYNSWNTEFSDFCEELSSVDYLNGILKLEQEIGNIHEYYMKYYMTS